MKDNYKIARIFGVDILLNPYFLLMLLFMEIIGGIQGMLYMLFTYLFVICHEFSHIFTARYYNVPCNKLVIMPLGCIAIIDTNTYKVSLKEEFWIILNGPLMNFALAILMFLFGLLNKFFYNLMALNIILGAFNLLPVIPMDGGRLLKINIRLFGYNNQSANRITGYIGMATAIIASIYFACHFMLFAVMIMVIMFTFCYKQVKNSNENVY